MTALKGVHPSSRSSLTLAMLLLVMSEAGCHGAGNWEPGTFESTRQLTVSVKIGQDANDNSPIAMSIVLAYDKDLQKALAAMDAKQWFLARKQFLKDHPLWRHEFMYEYVPGQDVRPVVLTIREGQAKGYVFVNYRAVGTWRYEFDPNKPVRVNFGKETMSVAQD